MGWVYFPPLQAETTLTPCFQERPWPLPTLPDPCCCSRNFTRFVTMERSCVLPHSKALPFIPLEKPDPHPVLTIVSAGVFLTPPVRRKCLKTRRELTTRRRQSWKTEPKTHKNSYHPVIPRRRSTRRDPILKNT